MTDGTDVIPRNPDGTVDLPRAVKRVQELGAIVVQQLIEKTRDDIATELERYAGQLPDRVAAEVLSHHAERIRRGDGA